MRDGAPEQRENRQYDGLPNSLGPCVLTYAGREEQKMTSACPPHTYPPCTPLYGQTADTPSVVYVPTSDIGVVASIFKDRTWHKGMTLDSEEPCSNMDLLLTSRVNLGGLLEDSEPAHWE